MQAVRPRLTRHYRSHGPHVVRSDTWARPVSPPPRHPVPTVPEPPPKMKPPRQTYQPYAGPPESVHQSRLTVLVVLWVAFAVVLVGRLVQLQVLQRDALTAKAIGQQERHIVADAQRGRIVDRNGTDLAVSLAAASVAINPRRVKRPGPLARKISSVTGEPTDRVYRRIARRTQAFAWVARNVDVDVARRLVNLDPGAMWTLSGTKRAHPFGVLAGQTLGHVDIDNNGGGGVERYYDAVLRGRNGWTTSLVDAFGERVPNTAQPYVAPRDGDNLTLTLDADYQAIVEYELATAVEATRAESGMAVIYDASTGAIRAMANVPAFNPDDYATAADPGRRRNRVITDPYEPGSMFKIVTASAALAEGVITPDEVVDCQNGYIVVAGQTIRDSHPNGKIPFREVIAHSSNVGTIKTAMRLSAGTFYEYIRLFGFGAETGVDLPGESKGIFRKRSAWSARSQATLAIGQEISVTALQVAAAYGAVANGGWLMRPYLVDRITAPDGKVVKEVKPRRVRQVIPAAVADEMVDMLCEVVEEGTGTTAKIAGLRVAGKTGTAEIARSDGRGYEPGAYVASFAGFLPEMTPRLVCVVSVMKPRTTHYGSTVAAPVFKRIMSRILNRDAAIVRSSAEVSRTPMPDLSGLDKSEAQARLGTLGATVRMVGQGDMVIGQWPPASARVPVAKPVELILADRSEFGPKVPDVRGMTVRQALAVLSAAGLEAKLDGSGVVLSQEPPPGARPRQDRLVRLRSKQPRWEQWLRRRR